MMFRRAVFIFACSSILCGGCRMGVQQRAVLTEYEHELRRYEDVIYDLDYENQTLSDENNRLQERIALLEDKGTKRASETPRFTPPSTPSTPSSPSDPRNRFPLKSKTPPDDDPDLSPPVIEEGTPMSPPLTTPPRPAVELPPRTNLGTPSELAPTAPPENSPPSSSPPPRLFTPPRNPAFGPRSPQPELPAPRNERPTSSAPEFLPEPTDRKVSQIFIDPKSVAGIDLDHRSGDDAVRIALEPRNAEGEVLPIAGKISVVILDPALEGEEARVGRWEFEAETVRHLMRTAGKRNIPLELPLLEQRPRNNRLTMFVRFETDAGDRLEASREVRVSLPGQQSIASEWMPRAASRVGPADVTHERNVQPAAHTASLPHESKESTRTHEETPDTSSLAPPKLAPVKAPPKPAWKPSR